MLLGSDIDFSGETLEPIGNVTHYFLGTFDGQGHVITNLAMNSTLETLGLFGYSKGIIVKNLVLDGSSHTENNPTYESGPAVGSFLGLCVTKKGSAQSKTA